MDYRNTVNLPQTGFAMKANLAQKEPAFQKRWREAGLYGQMRKARAGCPKYILHDGPPYPTGDLHVGTGLNKILKDIVVRFKTLSGFDAPYVPGWDCHGLPIEHKVLQELGGKARTMSTAEIRGLCKKYAMKYVNAQRDQFTRLGVSGDWDNPYLTLNPSYEAGVIDVFRKLVARGFVTRNLKPTHWCMSCRTVLAEAELEYDDDKSPSIYVLYGLTQTPRHLYPKLAADEPVSVLIWTTTPWTLPANRAIAVAPRANYVCVRFTRKDGRSQTCILADDLVEKVMANAGATVTDRLGVARGEALAGLTYRHRILDRLCPIVLADYVSLEDGTGCVHTAPGHGAEDYITGVRNGLEIASPVDEGGHFTAEAGPFAGRQIWEANPAIVHQLDEWGVLFHSESFTHSYPHCWRCRKPVIFRATSQWFVQIEHRNLRQKALEAVHATRWIPPQGEARISAMIQERPDWCISRQRVWGVPIPALYCEKCNQPVLTEELAAHVSEVFRQRGAESWFTEDVSLFVPPGLKCPNCGDTAWRKETDIFDVWFESGSSHRSVVQELPQLQFPADLYLEGHDQHRGWFQLSLLPAVASLDTAPFKAVLTHGFVVDEAGKKMSKSLGNFISVGDALKDFPADILRLWVAMTDYRVDIHVSRDLINRTSDVYRRIRNTFKYLLGNLDGFDPAAHAVPLAGMLPIDQWALARLHEVITGATKAMEAFEFHRAFHLIHHFCAVDLSSFYLDVLKDRMYCDAAGALSRRSGQTAMRHILLALVRLTAPVIVHTAEEVWDFITSKDEDVPSVHLAHWPAPDPAWRNDALLKTWARVQQVRADVLREIEKLRAAKIIGSAQEAVVRLGAKDELFAFLKSFEDHWQAIFISSLVELVEGGVEGVDGMDCPGLKVNVARASHPKCVRCWNLLPSVGACAEHPELCERCVAVVKAM
ncbi:MAG TPA: isoleucine--tRNA ligase [Candidatus Brocadiia bacterium]|nr:isoleucine--tRNA ligase [Candidatus Brocadiia bacterium]